MTGGAIDLQSVQICCTSGSLPSLHTSRVHRYPLLCYGCAQKLTLPMSQEVCDSESAEPPKTLRPSQGASRLSSPRTVPSGCHQIVLEPTMLYELGFQVLEQRGEGADGGGAVGTSHGATQTTRGMWLWLRCLRYKLDDLMRVPAISYDNNHNVNNNINDHDNINSS